MDIQRTEAYYRALRQETLCDCAYCRNYYQEIRAAYPALTAYLARLGIDIAKPFETMPLEPYAGMIEYMAVQYVVMGMPDDFFATDVSGVQIGIADSHPTTDISEDHFVIEISPITLPWTIQP